MRYGGKWKGYPEDHMSFFDLSAFGTTDLTQILSLRHAQHARVFAIRSKEKIT